MPDLMYQETFDIPGTYSGSSNDLVNTGWSIHDPDGLGELNLDGYDTYSRFQHTRPGGSRVLFYREDLGRLKSLRSEFIIHRVALCYAAIFVRLDPETDSYYAAYINTGGSAKLVKCINGVQEDLVSRSIARTTEWQAVLEVNNNNLTLWSNDEALMNARDEDLTDGYAGFGYIGTGRRNACIVEMSDLKLWYREPKYVTKVT